jgi:hypothetical protein
MPIRRSDTGSPHPCAIRRTESRVTPGRMEPDKGGVTISSPIMKKMFIVPTSSTSPRPSAESQSTWSYPLSLAFLAAKRLAA